MSTDDPEITTVTSNGQITIPRRLREEFELDKGTKLMVIPTDHGLVLQKPDLPSVDAVRERVEERAGDVELSMDQVADLVHEARRSKE